MYKNKKILAIIPARGGSKRIPRKNIKLLNGKPLISYAINAAKKSKYIDRIIVSTDDKKIARVAKKCGAEVPFMRPAELASDTASALPVIQHAVRYFEDKKKFKPDLIVIVQPTSPLVIAEDIDGTIEKIVTTGTNSCFSASKISQRPEWMYLLNNKKPTLFLNKSSLKARSQDLPELGIINGAVYVMTHNTIMKRNKIIDENTSIYLMPRERTVDIDELFDFQLAEFLMKANKK